MFGNRGFWISYNYKWNIGGIEWVIVGMESVEGEIQVSDMDNGFLSSASKSNTMSSSHCSCHL